LTLTGLAVLQPMPAIPSYGVGFFRVQFAVHLTCLKYSKFHMKLAVSVGKVTNASYGGMVAT